MNEEVQEEPLIDCVGVDGRKHVCRPHDTITKCGVPIKHKMFLSQDYKRFGCYECTY